MKVALVHDYLIRFGGAERVLLELVKIFPEAPIYTLLYDEKMAEFFPVGMIRFSFLQKLPAWLRRRYKYLLPLLPVAAEVFDLREFDLVISSSSAFAKGVITRPKTIHIDYCHNPARFLWDYSHEYLNQQNLGFLRNLAVNLMLNYLRVWDRSANKRVDYFIANSKITADRIKKYYRREAKIIYPPVRMAEFIQSENLSKGYFLIVSQLSPYKKVDIAVEAFNKLELPLVIIGDGSQKRYLKKIAKENIKILGWLDDDIVADYFKSCCAFVFPCEDDFGITVVEAMSYGKPVLAYKEGGALETVLEGRTGEFFNALTPEVLADGVRRLQDNLEIYDPKFIRSQAEKFSEERFKKEIVDFIAEISYNIDNKE